MEDKSTQKSHGDLPEAFVVQISEKLTKECTSIRMV